jgi:hypothetical protein
VETRPDGQKKRKKPGKRKGKKPERLNGLQTRDVGRDRRVRHRDSGMGAGWLGPIYIYIYIYGSVTGGNLPPVQTIYFPKKTRPNLRSHALLARSPPPLALRDRRCRRSHRRPPCPVARSICTPKSNHEHIQVNWVSATKSNPLEHSNQAYNHPISEASKSHGT